ncbi:O-antigen ligase family protein [Thermus igniterrae]|uniref:O-antigen ligase family protein n=1 Tax=Thermus igniterrae TaxID=88189 RepID=UPI00037CDA10|nr:O-antigen ligase family protein [Thermus igniterrae]
MNLLRRWWWPLFAFLYPLVVWPSAFPLEGVVRAKLFFTLLALLGGLFLELSAHPGLHLRDLGRAPRFLRQHPPLLLALLLGFWMTLSTALSPQPEVALTGSLVHGGDSLVWGLLMLGVFALAYLRALSDPELGGRLAHGVLAGALVLLAMALVEVLIGRGIYYRAEPWGLPVATFPGKGHLAAYFVLGFGVASGLWIWTGRRVYAFLALLLAFGLGLTFNRAGLLALGVVFLLSLRLRPRLALALALAGALGVLSGWELVRLANPAGVREVASGHTFFTRLYYWKAALGGIAARPLWGWGGGVFENYWPNYLSHSELEHFVEQEWGYDGLSSVLVLPPLSPLFLFDKAPEPFVVRSLLFRAHNALLEVGVKWGTIGLWLFLMLWGPAFLPLRTNAFFQIGLWAVGVYLLFWFIIPEYEGVLWLILAAMKANGNPPSPTGGIP